MISFWEKTNFIAYDYIIIGSGLMGLHLAYELYEKDPQAKIIILERGLFPSGASTKNAGFACFGSLSEILSDIDNSGLDATLALVEKRFLGIQLLKNRLGIDAMEYENHGGYELLLEDSAHLLDQLHEVNNYLKPFFNREVFHRADEQISGFGFQKKLVKHLLFNPFEGQLNTGKMMQSFLQLIASKGIRILTGAEVTSIDGQLVSIHQQATNEGINLQATRQIFIAANAFTSTLIPSCIVKPGRGQILITKPIPQLKLKGVFHMDEGYYYFRNVADRILFGGGRNLNFQEEESIEFKNTDLIIDDLKRKLEEIISPQQAFEIDMQWSGIMGFSENKLPILKKVDEHTIVAMSCNGMGVALSGIVAQEAMQLLK